MRKGLINFKVFVFLISAVISACSNNPHPFNTKQEIPLQVVRQSSGLIHCYAVFGYSIKKLEEENEILIQLGTMDTADNQPTKALAVIKTRDSERTLYLVNSRGDRKGEIPVTIEEYSGEGYRLVLSYSERPVKGIDYDASCIISKGKLKSEYKLEGKPNIYGY